MTKQEQKDEIILIVKQAIKDNSYEGYNPVYGIIEVNDFDNMAEQIAEALYNAGYRKTFTSELAIDTQKAFKEGYEKGKTDTLERVAKYLDAQGRYFGLGYRIKQHLSEIDELLKEYEVEE